MPKGSCNLQCQRGALKASGAYFKFFCPEAVKGAFVAKVNDKAKFALMWVDNGDSSLWKLGASSAASLAQQPVALSEQTSTNEEILAASMSVNEDPGPMRVSAPSETQQFLPGEHVLIVQGRPELDEMFAIQDLRLTGDAAAKCFFFLEGKDKTKHDC